MNHRSIANIFPLFLIAIFVVFKAANEMSFRLLSYEFDMNFLYVIVIVTIFLWLLTSQKQSDIEVNDITLSSRWRSIIAFLVAGIVAFLVYLKTLWWPICIEMTAVAYALTFLLTYLLLE